MTSYLAIESPSAHQLMTDDRTIESFTTSVCKYVSCLSSGIKLEGIPRVNVVTRIIGEARATVNFASVVTQSTKVGKRKTGTAFFVQKQRKEVRLLRRFMG